MTADPAPIAQPSPGGSWSMGAGRGRASSPLQMLKNGRDLLVMATLHREQSWSRASFPSTVQRNAEVLAPDHVMPRYQELKLWGVPGEHPLLRGSEEVCCSGGRPGSRCVAVRSMPCSSQPALWRQKCSLLEGAEGAGEPLGLSAKGTWNKGKTLVPPQGAAGVSFQAAIHHLWSPKHL